MNDAVPVLDAVSELETVTDALAEPVVDIVLVTEDVSDVVAVKLFDGDNDPDGVLVAEGEPV